MRYNYIAVEGNIGVGKTSLATRISGRYNGKLILEQFAENPFLAKFYGDQEKYAFPLELSFLADRYKQLQKELASQDLFSSFTISDYFLNKSLIFARKTLGQDEYQLFRTLFDIMNARLPHPDLLVHLYVKTERLQQNIRNRGREYEQAISNSYLDNIQESYFNYLRQQPGLRVLFLDVNDIDFVTYPSHLELVLKAIDKDYPKGVNSHIIKP